MEGQFVFQVAVELPPMEEGAKAFRKFVHAVSMMRAMARASCCQ
jgi:hypothetical protein